jgi:uracil-DNA glycosylase family protein
LRKASKGCKACDLWRTGTQTVFGEGGRHADVVFVGEQPGDQEDIAGKPFVGPSGKLLDDALAKAGIDRSTVYVTNVVKHFKWERAGKTNRRLHKNPNSAEIRACRPWLEVELELLKPRVVVCLGATAAKALLGASFRVTQQRGKPQRGTGLADMVIATVHPSSVLRAPDPESRRVEMRDFFKDIKKIARYV